MFHHIFRLLVQSPEVEVDGINHKGPVHQLLNTKVCINRKHGVLKLQRPSPRLKYIVMPSSHESQEPSVRDAKGVRGVGVKRRTITYTSKQVNIVFK